MARRKKGEEEEVNTTGWMTTFSDLVTLLLTFFVLLNTMSAVVEHKMEQLYQSLQASFGFMSTGTSAMETSYRESTETVSAPINPVEQDYEAIKGLVKEQAVGNDVQLMRSGRQRTIVVAGALLFEPESTELTPEARQFLARVADIIRDRTYPISIRGHTDAAPPLDPNKDNWTISGERALAVLRFLVDQGVDPRRLHAVGMAGYQPLVPNTDPRSRRLNNRVELVLNAKDVSRYFIPQNEREGLEFRGFIFNLPGQQEQGAGPKVKGKIGQ